MAKSFISANLATVSGKLSLDYVNTKGESLGNVMFLGKGVKSREQHADANAAIASFVTDQAAGELPKDLKTLVNGEYMTLKQAAKLDLAGYQFEGEDKDGIKYKPSWQIQFMDTKHVKAKNEAWAKGTAAPVAKPAAPVSKW